MKKLILILTLILALALCFVACEQSDKNDIQKTEDPVIEGLTNESPTTEAPTIEYEDQTVMYVQDGDTPKVSVPYDMSLEAYLYLDTGERGEIDSMYFDYTDGKLTINDVLYDQITYEQNNKIKYAKEYNCYDPEISIEYTENLSGTDDEKEIITVMMRIAQQKNRYVLKASVENEAVENIVAYHFDGMCYFVSFDEDDAVSKIYRKKIELPEPVLVNGMEIDIDLFAMWNIYESGGAGTIRVTDNEIHLGNSLFKTRYISNDTKINIEWCRKNLSFEAVKENEGMDVLDKINQENGYFVIYCVSDSEYYMIYVIDDVYYVIEELGNNNPMLKIGRMYYSTNVSKVPETEEPTTEKLTTEEPTSEEPTSEEPTTNIAQERVPEFENEGLISTLVEYLKNLLTAYDMPPTSFAIKIDDIKNGDQPLLVSFNPEEYYFVCGYYNAAHKYSEYEGRGFCCVTEYAWVKFESETDIQEYYDGKKFIVAFQINKSLLVDDILSDDSTVPHMEHFQVYETIFEDAKNVNSPIAFDETFIYLNSKNKSEIYHSVDIVNHEWITLPCVEIDGEFYIIQRTHAVRENGDTTYVDLKGKFGEYYDALIEIMQADKYSNTDKNGKTSHYGLFNIEEFVSAILK